MCDRGLMVRAPGCCAGRPKVPFQDRTSFFFFIEETGTYLPHSALNKQIKRLRHSRHLTIFYQLVAFTSKGGGYSILCLMLCFKWLNFRNLVNGRSYKAHCNKHCHTKNAAVLGITSHNARCDGHKVSRIRAVMSPPLRLAYIEN